MQSLHARAAQPMAREAVLGLPNQGCPTHNPHGLFAWLISSWKGLLSIFWQIKRSKPKPSSVWFSWNQLGFVVKTFFFFWSSATFWDRFLYYWPKSAPICSKDLFFLVFTYFCGQICETLAELSTNFVQQTCIIWSLTLVKMHEARNNFSVINVAHTSKKVGHPCSTLCTVAHLFNQ